MTISHFIFSSTFTLGMMGLATHRTHLISALLCIEAMMLALYLALTMLTSTTQLPSTAIAPTLLLAFSACEAGAGLAILVATSRTHNTDHLKALNLLQC